MLVTNHPFEIKQELLTLILTVREKNALSEQNDLHCVKS